MSIKTLYSRWENWRWRRFSLIAAALIFIVILFIGPLFAPPFCTLGRVEAEDVSSLEYEAKLRSNLTAHDKDFERLIKMIQADKIEKIHVPKEGAWIFYTPLSENRISEYRLIMQSLGIERGMHRLNPNAVILVVDAGGFAGHGWEVGYVWSLKTPQSRTGTVFKPVHDNWYLYNFDLG